MFNEIKLLFNKQWQVMQVFMPIYEGTNIILSRQLCEFVERLEHTPY